MAKPSVTDIKALTDAELETLQLQVNAEVAARIQDKRLEERLVTALTDAQGIGFTDAQIDSVFAKSRDRVKKGRQDPDAKMPKAAEREPKKAARSITERSTAVIKSRATTKKAT